MSGRPPEGPALRRNQLAWLTVEGWAQIGAGAWDDVSRACLLHWHRHGLPLVVTQQSVPGTGTDTDLVALGLPAPLCWERRRMPLVVPRAHVESWGDFPTVDRLCETLPVESNDAWCTLCAQLDELGLTARVHGSHGWQLITGLAYVRPTSDIDLSVAVTGLVEADAAAALLQAVHHPAMSLDGELVWPDGQAVAWREWQAWRSGRVKSILVKHVGGHRLVHERTAFAVDAVLEDEA